MAEYRFAGFDSDGQPEWDNLDAERTDAILAADRELTGRLADEILALIGQDGIEAVADYYRARRPQLDAELAEKVAAILDLDVVDDDELRYDPDQPRDEHGRWTSEGGEKMVTVYHGKGLNAGSAPMNPKGFYVTADKEMAEKFFGDVHKVDVKEADLMPDPEQEGVADKKLTGWESLMQGSAVVPHRYYEKLEKVGPKVFKSGRLGNVTIPED